MSIISGTAEALGILKITVPENEKVPINAIVHSRKNPFPKIKGFVVHLDLKTDAKPIQLPPRRVPSSLEGRIKLKLDELEELDIIEKVNEPCEWLSALVPVLKNNGDLRLCVDLRRLNSQIEREKHPLPTFETIMPHLKDAKLFSLLDIKQAYHQCELDKESRPLTSFLTDWGIYRYKRLVFGVSSAPEKFQKIMEKVLSSCRNVVIFIDDILVYGKDEKDHDESLQLVLQTLEKHNILLNSEKCVIKVKEIKFLGHMLSDMGIAPAVSKVEAVEQFRAPKNKDELRSFLGLACYVAKFIPDLATLTFPLRELIKTNVVFEWISKHQDAFDKIKEHMSKADTLGFFDPNHKTLLIADASPYGLGAVLVQFKAEGPRIISYAAKSLSEAEMRYCQTEKEALALVWGVERFWLYLIGTVFELETDHKALETIFATNSRPCARIERWVLRLQAFRFKVKYRSGKANLADPLSRLTVKDAEPFDEESDIYINEIKMSAALDISEVEKASESDNVVQLLKQAIDDNNFEREELKEFLVYKDQLIYVDNLIIRMDKIFIPKSLRQRFLELAHEGHPGESLMKRRLRSTSWWPGLDKDVSRFVKTCQSCLIVSAPSKPEPMTRRPLPIAPWIDIAIDFLGPLPTGEFLLVVIDYFSRYMEVKIMKSITAEATIDVLDEVFLRLGYPRTITLDNGRQFVSTKFHEYCKFNGIHLNHVAPYWPQANGLVERQNRSLLKRIRIGYAMHGEWKSELRSFLLMYNTTPHSTTNKTPTEALHGFTIRSKIPRLIDIETTPLRNEMIEQDFLLKEKGKDMANRQRHAKESDIQVGDTVLRKNLIKEDKLTTTFDPQEFEVINRKGPVVTIQSKVKGDVYDRNVAHVKKISKVTETESDTEAEFKGFTDEEDAESQQLGSCDVRRQLPGRERRLPGRYKD